MASSQADRQESTVIDNDVLYKILLRLPAKPLCRLRAVCRSWRSLLSAPSFIAAHRARQAAPLLVLHRHDGSTLTVHVLDILSGEPIKRIRAKSATRRSPSSPVLLRIPDHLSLVRLPFVGDDHHGLRLRLLDLVTGDEFALPYVKSNDPYISASFMVGRVSIGDYKVLCLCIGSSIATFCKVLTLSGNGGDHRWRDTGCPPAKVMMLHRGAATVKEIVYFLLSAVYYSVESKGCIMAYDLEKEVWLPGALPAPVPSNKLQATHTLSHGLSELGGCLALLYEDWHTAFKELWLLTDPGKAIWSRRCTITVPYGVQGSCISSYIAEILWLLDDGRIIILMSLGAHSVLCTYDPRTMTYTNVSDLSEYLLEGVYTGSLLGQGSLHLLQQGGSV